MNSYSDDYLSWVESGDEMININSNRKRRTKPMYSIHKMKKSSTNMKIHDNYVIPKSKKTYIRSILMERIIEKQRERIKYLNERVQQKSYEYSKLKDQFKTIYTELVKSKSEVKKFKAINEEHSNEARMKSDYLEKKLAAKNQLINEFENSENEMVSHMKELESENNGLKSINTQLKKEFERIKNDNHHLKTTVDEKELATKNYEIQIKQLLLEKAKYISESRNEMNRLNDSIKTAEDQIKMLNNELKTKQCLLNEVNQMKLQINNLKIELASCKEMIESKSALNEQLKEKLKFYEEIRMEDENQRMPNVLEIEELKTRIKFLESEINFKNNDFNKLNQQLDIANKNLTDKDTLLNKLNEQLKELKEKRCMFEGVQGKRLFGLSSVDYKEVSRNLETDNLMKNIQIDHLKAELESLKFKIRYKPFEFIKEIEEQNRNFPRMSYNNENESKIFGITPKLNEFEYPNSNSYNLVNDLPKKGFAFNTELFSSASRGFENTTERPMPNTYYMRNKSDINNKKQPVNLQNTENASNSAQCPYCFQFFKGSRGVAIHIGHKHKPK